MRETGRRHFEVFPFEKKIEHGDRLAKQRRNLISVPLFSEEGIRLFPSFQKKLLCSNKNYFLLEVNFPTVSSVVKLVNINEREITVETILKEFHVFYEEIYTLERLTLEEEKVEEKCFECLHEEFSRFERREELCPICSEKSPSLNLDCKHYLCVYCLKKWFAAKNSCPFCRQPIKPCRCGGKRESSFSRILNLESYFLAGLCSTGFFRLRPFFLDQIMFSCLIYDRISNVFRLIQH